MGPKLLGRMPFVGSVGRHFGTGTVTGFLTLVEGLSRYAKVAPNIYDHVYIYGLL
jgi:hypothetical protein